MNVLQFMIIRIYSSVCVRCFTQLDAVQVRVFCSVQRRHRAVRECVLHEEKAMVGVRLIKFGYLEE